jgi:hypothetical protein
MTIDSPRSGRAWGAPPGLFLVLVLAPVVAAAPPSQFAADTPHRALSLAECRQLALANHPRIKAYRMSLASAVDASQALNEMRSLLSHQLPVRRQQADLGITAASAAVAQAEQDALYDVTRTFFTVLYAREQERVATGVVDRLSATYDTAQKQLKAGAKDVTDVDVKRTEVYLRLAQTKQVEAAKGSRRALVALREAMGFGPDFCFDVPAGRLPEPTVRPDRCQVVAAALAQRGELAQAAAFADAVGLEVDAQGKVCFLLRRVQTFASGSDIHSQQVPETVRSEEYRPGGIPPEMPGQLVGSRGNRIQRASDLQGRADSVVTSTTNLIALQAEDAYLRWEQATEQIVPARLGAESGQKLADDVNKDYTTGLKVRVEDVVNLRVLASQARSSYNEYRYRQLLTLAELERVTGGAFCARLGELVLPKP